MMEDQKLCKRCDTPKPHSAFGPNRARKDGLAVYCRPCTKSYFATKHYDAKRWAENHEIESQRNKIYRASNAERIKEADKITSRTYREENPGWKKSHNITRKHGQKKATPTWADMGKINAIYREAKRLTEADGVIRHVDHEIPLKHPLVCGLHVENNLRILTAAENMAKHNRFDPG